MDLSKSVDFLLENAGDVIKYRLHKEILKDVSRTEEENLFEKVMQTSNFKLVKSYIKPNGYIGIGMHTGNNQEFQLKEGEAAARLLSSYAVPKQDKIIKNYINALRNEEILKEEFSFSSTAFRFYNDRFLGVNCGFSLMILLYTMQAMLGYGDDAEVKKYQNAALQAFTDVLKIEKLSVITKTNQRKGKYCYPYIEESTYLPSVYHLAGLAYTQNWRTPENIELLAAAINHRDSILPTDNNLQVKVKNNYYSVGLLFRPIKIFAIDNIDFILYRRVLTEIAMLGVGKKVKGIRESINNLEETLSKDGILKWNLSSYQKQQLRTYRIPSAYCDIWLEEDYNKPHALACDLTFWALQFLHIINHTK